MKTVYLDFEAYYYDSKAGYTLTDGLYEYWYDKGQSHERFTYVAGVRQD